MKNRCFSVLTAVICALLITAAHGYAKSSWTWTKYLFEGERNDIATMKRPYLYDGKTPNNTQWQGDNWRPRDWVFARDGAKNVIKGFYDADILREQTADGDLPIIRVGEGFMRLSQQDQIRVAQYIDYLYGITRFSKRKMIMIEHYTGDPIGIYNRYGLQLQ